MKRDEHKDWAKNYLRQRFYEQNLHINPYVTFSVEQYIATNWRYVIRNIKNGNCKEWNRSKGTNHEKR